MTNSNNPKIIKGRYIIQKIISPGGMTTVYRGRDLKTDEPIAIKRFDRDANLPRIEQEAFEREVEALKNLTHPNIVRIFDSGQDDEGKLFIILELMDHDLVKDKEIDGKAFEGCDDFTGLVILPLLNALAYAHEMGIAHRDVKPANVLVATDGTIKLADFGISKLKRTLKPRETLSSFMSPPFSPPEPDTGGYTYSRDVYSVGMIYLWGMSDLSIRDYNDVQPALQGLNADPDLVEIVKKAVSEQPAMRPVSAAVMAAEIERVYNKRRRVWEEGERPNSYLSLTKRALEAASYEIENQPDIDIRNFILQDINSDSKIQRFIDKPGTKDQAVVPYHYVILGSNFRHHVAEDTHGGNGLALLNVVRPTNEHFHLRDRQNSAPSPLTFILNLATGIKSKDEAITLIERVLEEFETNQKEEARRNKETVLFDTWIRVLDAKMQYEREKSKPINFEGTSINSPLVTLQTKDNTEEIQLGELRIIECDDGKWVRGEVWEIRPGEVILNCYGMPLSNLPQFGVAKLDQGATKVSIDRQREAVDRIRSGSITNSSLKGIINDPSLVVKPESNVVLDPKIIEENLDSSKQNALKLALGSKDILLVEGPPGTGKTTFISVLVSEEIRRNPKAHILLASQTHVAIDNAIEKINKIDNKIKIIRIANNQFSNVAELSEAYLMSNQLKSWRNEVFERAEKGLENWSTSHNLDLKHIKIGIVIRQIANVSENINSCRQKIEEEENRKSELEKETGENSSSIDNSIEIDRISEELNEFRTQLDVGKKELDGLKKSIIAITPEAQEFLDETIKDQLIWADTLVGSSEEEKLAKSLIKLQADWFYRFGSMEGFVKPLIERASVVAATCVGLAAIGEINELDFDLCIIDEASKATAMESAVPMARAKKWVLVGDSKQLGPFQEEILRKPELKERFEIGSPEASETMFQRFLRLLPKENRVRLTHQYRMVVPIRDLMNECFYGDLEGGKDSIDRIICSYTGKAVNWFSTSQVERRMEQGIGNTFSNQEEVTRICELVLAIEQSINKLSAKKKVNDNKTIPTLVLSGYEAQTKLLKSRLNQITRDLKTLKIECSTIDQVQGREADVVIFSLTRSNKDSKVGFLKELERINVALSRARELLYIIGDDRFVVRAENAQSLQKVLNHIKNSPDCYFRELKN